MTTIWHRDRNESQPITRMVWLISFGRPDSFVISPKIYASEFKATYQTFVTMTIPATETTPIGLPADAQAVMVFASSLRQFYRDGTTPFHLPGFSTLTATSGRENSRPSTGTLQKPRHRLTQPATPHTTGPSDCLITPQMIRYPKNLIIYHIICIDYLIFFTKEY